MWDEVNKRGRYYTYNKAKTKPQYRQEKKVFERTPRHNQQIFFMREFPERPPREERRYQEGKRWNENELEPVWQLGTGLEKRKRREPAGEEGRPKKKRYF